jgi:ribosome biogenesis protein MAK21
MPPKPDLASHTLSAFLDRFVYRNAKAASAGPRGNSIMQPLSGGDSKAVLLSNKSSHTSQPLNTEAFWRKKAEDVAVDEAFFHKYFSQIGKTKQASSKKKVPTRGEDGEDEDADEDEIWQALVESRPEVEGNSDESDMEMLDLDDSDMEDDSDLDMSDGGVEINMDDDESDVEGEEVDEDEFPGSEVGSEPEIPEDEDDEDEDALFAKELQSAQPADEDKDEKETSRKRKQRLKKLPMFASMEDYAAMVDNDDDEDQGL